MSEEQEQSVPSPEPKRGRVVKRTPPPTIEAYRSYWPLALAIAMVILLIGIISNSLIIGGIGVIAICAAVIGLGLEKRS